MGLLRMLARRRERRELAALGLAAEEDRDGTRRLVDMETGHTLIKQSGGGTIGEIVFTDDRAQKKP